MSAWRTTEPTEEDGNIFVQFVDHQDGEDIVCAVSHNQLVDPVSGWQHSRPLTEVARWCPLSDVERLIEEAPSVEEEVERRR